LLRAAAFYPLIDTFLLDIGL
jgi:hypothetical protein